jgi:hypothetical protein
MNDAQDQRRINGSYVFDGKPLEVMELPDRWRISYDGKEVEHANIDHALAGAVGRSPGLVLGLVRQILNSEPGSDLGS